MQHRDRRSRVLQIFANEIAHDGVVVDDQYMLSHAINFKTQASAFATARTFHFFPLRRVSTRDARPQVSGMRRRSTGISTHVLRAFIASGIALP